MNKPTDIEGKPLEIERKYLIEYPDVAWLQMQKDVQVVNIHQYYLDTETESKLRIRSWEEGDITKYILTKKTKITDLTRIEEEREITLSEFNQLLHDPSAKNRKQINKTRYRFPYAGKTIEVDIYPFWEDKAVAEVELQSEDETVSLPDGLKLIKEVTEDSSYTNYNLAKNCRIFTKH